MSEEPKELSIWFFCGILMLGYGIVLIATGLTELHNPPPTVLSNLEPTLWWGVLLTLFGAFTPCGSGPVRADLPQRNALRPFALRLRKDGAPGSLCCGTN